MPQNIACFLIFIGSVSLAVGLFLSGLLFSVCLLVVTCGVTHSAFDWLRQQMRFQRQARRMRLAQQRETPLALSLIPQLFGEYTPYIIEAAEQLGAARDATAVPALITLLERCVDAQRPGWRETAAAVVDALAEIGDCRALELLYRLENVRGIGVIPNIRNAIAIIEPQSILLRPGSRDDMMQAATLLRPAQASIEDESLLLRAAE